MQTKHYTVSQRSGPPTDVDSFLKNLIFTFFNVGKRSKLQTKPLYCVPPHPRYVAKHTLSVVGHYMGFICNLLLFPMLKEFCKLVLALTKLSPSVGGPLFGTQCILYY